MFTIKLPTIAAAAVIAAGLVAAADLAQSRTTDPSAAAVVADRFPTSTEMVIVLNEGTPVAPHAAPGGKSLVPAATCVREHWPYIADECLTTPDGRRVSPPTRTITIQRQIAGAAKTVQVADAASGDVASR